MFGSRDDWLQGHAEPVEHSAWFGGDSPEGGARTDETQWLTGAALEVHWRIHIPGREPYDFRTEYWDVPGWVVRGSLQGSRRWHVRLGGGNGLLRKVGVPCLVHPEDRYKIKLDWKTAYKAHEKEWDRQDAIDKRVTQRTEGILGKVLAPIQFIRPSPKFTAQEKAEIEAATDEKIAKIERHTGQEMNDRNLELNRQMHAEAERLSTAGIRVTGKVKSRRPVPYEGILNELIIDLREPGSPATRTVGYRFPLVGRKLEAATRPGKTIVVFLDPQNPESFVLEAHLTVEMY